MEAMKFKLNDYDLLGFLEALTNIKPLDESVRADFDDNEHMLLALLKEEELYFDFTNSSATDPEECECADGKTYNVSRLLGECQEVTISVKCSGGQVSIRAGISSDGTFGGQAGIPDWNCGKLEKPLTKFVQRFASGNTSTTVVKQDEQKETGEA